MMRYALKATEARQHYSRVMEDAVRLRPQAIKRFRDTLFLVSAEHLATMLSPCRLTLRVKREDDGSVYGVFDELDIMDRAKDLDELKRSLAQALYEYAESYLEDFQLYYNSANRRAHLPYVFSVMVQKDLDAVIGLFDAVME